MKANRKMKRDLIILSFALLLTLDLALTAPENVNAQAKPAFIISSMGSIPGTLNNGMVILFKSTTTCINVQNGISVLQREIGDRRFVVNCETTLNLNNLGIRLFPNPVSNIAKLRFINTPPINEIFSLSIITTVGVTMYTRKESGYNLFQGITVDLSNLPCGIYVLKIESEGSIDLIQFMKVN